jgi:hypothetical protein
MKTINSYLRGHAQNYDCLDEENKNALPATARVHWTHSSAINRTNARTFFKNKTISAAVTKAIDALKVDTAQERAPRAEEEPTAAAHLRDDGVNHTAEGAPSATNNNTHKQSVLNEVLVQSSAQQQDEHAVTQAATSTSASSDITSTRQRSEVGYIRPTRVLVQSKCTGMTYSVPQSLLEQVAEDRKRGRPIKKLSSIEDLYHAGIVPSGYNNDSDDSDDSSDISSSSKLHRRAIKK